MTSLGQASTQDSQNGPLEQNSDNVPTQSSIQHRMLDKNSEDQAPNQNNLNGTLDQTAKGHVPTHFISTGILEEKPEDEAPTQNSLNGKMNQASEGQAPTQNSLKLCQIKQLKAKNLLKTFKMVDCFEHLKLRHLFQTLQTPRISSLYMTYGIKQMAF